MGVVNLKFGPKILLFPKIGGNYVLSKGEMLGISKHLYGPQIGFKNSSIRVGEKGEGKFKQVSWEEAYDAILNGTR